MVIRYFCKAPGCNHRVDTPKTFCQDHIQQSKRRTKTAPASSSYARTQKNRNKWRKLSEEIRREEPVCWVCGQAESQVVDHARPAEMEPGLLYVRANLIPACRQCHDKILSPLERNRTAAEIEQIKRLLLALPDGIKGLKASTDYQSSTR